MNDKKKKMFITTVILLFMTSLIFAFSIFTNNLGYPRKYIDSDIPFVYQLNTSTPANWIPPVDAGAQSWEDVESAYWEFENGGLTPTNTDQLDGINLVFFDFQGVNFPVGTNAIAYSRTYVTGTGASYRAIESDLVFNARDYPPSPTGAPGQQDLQSVITHEFGHHLGLGHSGDVGSPPGVGPTFLQATMYGANGDGDTTKRSLHIDDISGVSAIYPVWKLQGNVTVASSGLPLPGAEITSNVTWASELDAPVFYGDRWQQPGYFRSAVAADVSGNYDVTVLVQNFNLEVEYFGYSSGNVPVSFSPAGGIGQTEVQILDFQLQENPVATISGSITDSLTGTPLSARIKVSAYGDKAGSPVGVLVDTTTSMTGDFSFSLISDESYRIQIYPEAPYPDREFILTDLPVSGAVLNYQLNKADILIVNDDLDRSFEFYYITSSENIQQSFHIWRVSELGRPDTVLFNKLKEPRKILWYTGDAADTVLSDSEQLLLANFLDNGGRLVLTGQNIAESSSAGVLMTNYLGIAYDNLASTNFVSGVPGDPVGNGLFLLTIGGSGNQNSKDALTNNGPGIVSLNYGTSTPSGIAGIRIENSQNNWRALFFGFGLEGINNTSGQLDTLFARIFKWYDAPTAIFAGDQKNLIPDRLQLESNYPNPFNSSTKISYSLPDNDQVSLAIYNILGQRVRTLVDENQVRGRYQVFWDGRDDFGNEIASGLYMYRLTTSGESIVKKMLYVR
jgi:hypothetical protein